MGRYMELYEQIQIDKLDQTYLSNMIHFYMSEKPLSYHDFYASLLNPNHHVQDRRNEEEKKKLYEDIFQEGYAKILDLYCFSGFRQMGPFNDRRNMTILSCLCGKGFSADGFPVNQFI